MKKIYTLLIFTFLINCAYAKTQTWSVIHTYSRVGDHDVDDGTDYIIKPVGNGFCLDPDHPTTPSSITIRHGALGALAGKFKINYIGNIFKKCGYEHSSQDFEVHSLTNPSISATFEWYSPYSTPSYIKVLNDPHHIFLSGVDPLQQQIYIGKWIRT